MTEQAVPIVRFGAAWQTQLRFVQSIGRGLAELTSANVEILIGGGHSLEAGKHRPDVYQVDQQRTPLLRAAGIFAGREPSSRLRTIAWFPQEDRLLFAVAPWIKARSFEELAATKPPLKMAAQRSVNPVLKEYGFSLEEIEHWGGKVESMHHTAQEAKEHFERGALDACFGDGSEFDGSAWKWMADRGYAFLDIRRGRDGQARARAASAPEHHTGRDSSPASAKTCSRSTTRTSSSPATSGSTSRSPTHWRR